MSNLYGKLIKFSTLLTLSVVILGAYVRLSDAGLGCPDWPGCYGKLIPINIDASETIIEYPERPLESGKAWKEMVHRYFASTLGFIILISAYLAWQNRKSVNQPVKIPIATLVVVIFQGLLGMWTVTLLLKPIIVMAHLIGGLVTLSMLFWLWLEYERGQSKNKVLKRSFKWPAAFMLLILSCQIALGGWTSSNYAALACPDLPTCLGQWWPEQANFDEGFIMWRGLGVNYEFGILEAPARVAIHFTHRLGAIFTTLILIINVREIENKNQKFIALTYS